MTCGCGIDHAYAASAAVQIDLLTTAVVSEIVQRSALQLKNERTFLRLWLRVEERSFCKMVRLAMEAFAE